MNTSITCPHCGKPVEITQALSSHIREEIVADLSRKHNEQLISMKKDMEASLRRELAQKSNLELTDLKKQLKEKEDKVVELQHYELKLREDKRRLEEKERELKLEVTRRIDEEKKKLEETILRQVSEDQRLKDQEKEKVIRDLQVALDDARRKAHQGSQQLQGEVQELDLESTLRNTFLHDQIEPVGKGVRGADIRQIVRTPLGNVCGVILWESKRTKAWSAEWITKLKEDIRSEKANIPIIVSSVLPDTASSGFGFVDGVYVVTPTLALSIAEVLRQKLIELAREKFILQNRESKAEELYEYVTSHEFRQQIEALVEIYHDMHGQILKERAAFEKIWKTREAQVTKMFTSTSGIVGSMRGRIGQSLPVVKGLELTGEVKGD